MKSGKKMEVSDELWEEYQQNLQKNPKGAYNIDPEAKLPQGSRAPQVRDEIAKAAGVGQCLQSYLGILSHANQHDFSQALKTLTG